MTWGGTLGITAHKIVVIVSAGRMMLHASPAPFASSLAFVAVVEEGDAGSVAGVPFDRVAPLRLILTGRSLAVDSGRILGLKLAPIVTHRLPMPP